MGNPHMDQETLQALIKVYKTRASGDLLSIIIDEAEGQDGQAAVLELLRTLPQDTLTGVSFAAARRKACRFSLNAEDFDLAEMLARSSEDPEEQALRARALFALNREQEAQTLYRQAVQQDASIRNRDLERLLGIRPGTPIIATPAKVISLNTYTLRRDAKTEQERRDVFSDVFLDDFDDVAFTFGDVAGLDDVKMEVRRRIVLPYLKPSIFERYKQKAGGNILLYGPPGCGKTLVARATAGESDARFLSVNPEDLIDKYPGEAEKRLRVMFDEARSDTPAILFFDEFDVVAQRAKSPRESVNALISAFASEIDGTQRNNSGVLVIVASNAPWLLDRALFRSMRLQSLFFVPPPDYEGRRKILTTAIAGIPGAEAVATDRIARKTDGFSGADLRALADHVSNASLTKALSGSGEGALTTAAFEDALRHFAPSTLSWLSHARDELKPLQRHDVFSRLFAPLARI